jgi:hypothetical protein
MTIEWTSLDPGEAPIWSGRPAPLRYAVSRSWDTFLFGICFFAVTLGALVSQIGKADAQLNLPFWLFWVAFMTTGAAMVPPPFRHLWRGLRATHVLTGKRALVAFARPIARRVSVPLGQIRFIDVRLSGGGVGTIDFKETADGEGGTKARRGGFVVVREVAHVERLLRRATESTAALRGDWTAA